MNDNQPPRGGAEQVFRGSSWGYYEVDSRTAGAGLFSQTQRGLSLGFRIVCPPGFQAYRGSCLEAVQPARGELPRSRSMVKVGIRLAVDWRHE